jgi:hypothetical protein
MALKTASPQLTLDDAVSKARESLLGGKALQVFKLLIQPITKVSFS